MQTSLEEMTPPASNEGYSFTTHFDVCCTVVCSVSIFVICTQLNPLLLDNLYEEL